MAKPTTPTFGSQTGIAATAFSEIAGTNPERTAVPAEMLLTESEMAALLSEPKGSRAAQAEQKPRITRIRHAGHAISLAKDLIHDEEYDEALEVLRNATQRFSDNAHLHHFFGVQLTKEYDLQAGVNRDEEAEYHLTRAHELAPEDTITLYELGRLYTRQGISARAEGDTERAIDRLIKAETTFINTISIKPDDHIAFWALGHVYASAGRANLARGCYGHAKTIAPTQNDRTPRIRASIEESLAEVQNFTKTPYTPADIAPVARAVQKQQNLLSADDKAKIRIDYVGRSKELYDEDNIHGAIHVLEEANKAEPDNYAVLFHLGLNYAELGKRGIEDRDAEAEKYLLAAHDADEEQVKPVFLLAKLYERQSRLEDAENTYFSALDIDDEDPFVYFALGDLYTRHSQGLLYDDTGHEAALARACYHNAKTIAGINSAYEHMNISSKAALRLRDVEEQSGIRFSQQDLDDFQDAYEDGMEGDDTPDVGGTDLDQP